MKDAFVTIHGHFYQPPRENPWLDVIEREESARPFHDWNERIASECYRPNGHARIVDGKGRILDIINNYSYISFNFGPTLLRWFEKQFPFAYQRILQADQESLKRLGHGNAIAQAYDHAILPLANERDRETEVHWGIADFQKRFRREPEALWLPETAVNYSTLEVLVRHGMKFLILSPYQALRIRPLGGARWTDVSQGGIDSTQPYRCFLREGAEKRRSDRFIDILFYEGRVSKEISFGDLLKDGNLFCDRLMKAYQPAKKRPQLIHLATDGETYGHHKKFGDMALAYALHQGLSSRGLEVINYGAFLERFPPLHEVELDEGPRGKGTSWSCSHGVGRWEEDCGCSTGGQPGWNQKWRKPLREALNLLRDELSTVFEREGEKVFRDPWAARNGYIQVILDRSLESSRDFFERFGLNDLAEAGRMKGLRLLEMERHALQMFTSCGWFFNDISGIETILILQHASRAIQLAENWLPPETEDKFLDRLAQAKSNLQEMGDGRRIYDRLVKSRGMTLEKVVNHYAISSLFKAGEGEKRIFSYRMDRVRYERIERKNRWIVVGEVQVTPETLPETRGYLFLLVPSTQDIFRTWIVEQGDLLSFEKMKAKGIEAMERDDGEWSDPLAPPPGSRVYTFRDTVEEGRQSLFEKIIQKEVDKCKGVLADLFDRTGPSLEPLARLGLEIPFEARVAAEVTLSDRLSREIERLPDDLKNRGQGPIDRIIEEAKLFGYTLRREGSCSLLSERLNQKMEALQKGLLKDPQEPLEVQAATIGGLIALIDLAERWGFDLRKGEAQNVMGEILDKVLGNLEMSWWGWGAYGERHFSPNLIVLAEKLGFNVDRFSKVRTAG